MSEERKPWIVLGAVSGLIAAGLATLIYFQHKELERKRGEAESLRQVIAKDRALVEKTPDLIKKVIVQRETDTVIKEILSDTQEVNDFVRTLEKFARESGITFSSYKRQRENRRKKEEFERVGYVLSFDADAFQLLDFMNKVESHPRFISVTDFKLRAASRNAIDSEELPRHSVTMNLETYVYKEQGVAKPRKIASYEKKRDLLIGQISEKTSALRVPVYQYHGRRGRRDPWIDPRIPVQDGPQITIEDQLRIVEELIAKATEVEASWKHAREAQNVVESMRARNMLEEKLALLEEEIRRVQAEGQLVYINARRRFDKEVVGVVARVREEMNGTSGGIGPAVALLRETAAVMQRHIEAQEYELALQAFETVDGRLAIAERDPSKRELVARIRDLHDVAETVIAFEAIPLEIGGVVVYEDLRPVALINGRAVSEGELIDNELIVHQILPDQIEFAFRGLILARVIEPAPVETPQ